jgi:metallopeptidase MepB
MFHGHRTVSDFSEAPSQLLEYWCWVPECLKQLSCHYSYLSPKYLQHWKTAKASKDDLQPLMEIPNEIVHNLVAAKQLNQGILTLRQVAFSKFDMKIHNPASHDEIEAIDFSKLYNLLLQDMTGLQGPQDGLNWGSGHATSSHYIWGQEANYYSYLLYASLTVLINNHVLTSLISAPAY